MSNPIKLHIKHKYIISVKQIDESNIIITYPNNIVYKPYYDEYIMFFGLTEDGLEISEGKRTRKIECENYAKRILVIEISILEAYKRMMEPKLMIYYDKFGERLKNNLNIMSIMREPSTQEDKDKESKLFDSLIALIDGNPLTIDESIEDGYNLLLEEYKI